MLPVNCGSHADYQNFVVTNLRKYYPDPNAFSRDTWDIIERFWNLDLSYTDELLATKYSKFGPAPRTPSCMQRSYLLSIDFKVHSITDWAAQLKINPLYAILSGFNFGNTPGVGTFYDFFRKLWDSDSDNLSPHIRPLKKKKVEQPKQKGSKAQPYASLFKIYSHEFLTVSISKGFIDPSGLSIAGDGTPVVTSARERKHRVCDCREKGITNCECDRYFSQPDCDIGWDSSRDCFYNGYDLYMLVAANSESDLPLFSLLHPASKHDSHGFLETYFRFRAFLPDLHVSK